MFRGTSIHREKVDEYSNHRANTLEQKVCTVAIRYMSYFSQSFSSTCGFIVAENCIIAVVS